MKTGHRYAHLTMRAESLMPLTKHRENCFGNRSELTGTHHCIAHFRTQNSYLVRFQSVLHRKTVFDRFIFWIRHLPHVIFTTKLCIQKSQLFYHCNESPIFNTLLEDFITLREIESETMKKLNTTQNMQSCRINEWNYFAQPCIEQAIIEFNSFKTNKCINWSSS